MNPPFDPRRSFLILAEWRASVMKNWKQDAIRAQEYEIAAIFRDAEKALNRLAQQALPPTPLATWSQALWAESKRRHFPNILYADRWFRVMQRAQVLVQWTDGD